MYPCELLLLQEGISLADQEKLGEEKKWWYYYLILASRLKEKEEMEKEMDESKMGKEKDTVMHYPDDWVSKVNVNYQLNGIVEDK